jgi:hypothetical protein
MKQLLALVSAGVVAIVSAAGCTDVPVRGASPQPSGTPKEPAGVSRSVNLSGFPPEYKRAFEDGCTAAKRDNPTSRPRGDGPAAQGWNDGYAYCRPR